MVIRITRIVCLVLSAILLIAIARPPEALADAPRPLSWSPPVLEALVTVNVTAANRSLSLAPDRDYRVVLPSAPLQGGLSISGGRNVVIIGGEIAVPSAAQEPLPQSRRGLYLVNQTGTVHVEGVKISGVDLAEGIDLDQRQGATVQLQNIAIDTVYGSQATNHADLLQSWSGPRRLRIDGFTGTTTYQGMFLLAHQFPNPVPVEPWDFRNVEIVGLPGSGYGFWKEDGAAVNVSNVSFRRTDNTTNKVAWPSVAEWPGLSFAAPPTTPVLSGTPGVNYTSPGYAGEPQPQPTNPPQSTVPPQPQPQPQPQPTNPPQSTVPPQPSTQTKRDDGYWMSASDGGVFSFGGARFLGSMGGTRLNAPVVGMAPVTGGMGYWLVATDGGIFAFGDAGFYGSTGAMRLNSPIVAMSPTPTGKGYWLVAGDGGIFAFGDAGFYGSTGAMRLNRPIVGMAPTPTGKGYWLVASDGGIFTFGDAEFRGSLGGAPLNQPVTSMSGGAYGTGNNGGYRLVGADGGVFNFGNVGFYGSAAGKVPGRVTGIFSSSTGAGYWVASSAGAMLPFGDAGNHGSVSGSLNAPVVGAAVLTR